MPDLASVEAPLDIHVLELPLSTAEADLTVQVDVGLVQHEAAVDLSVSHHAPSLGRPRGLRTKFLHLGHHDLNLVVLHVVHIHSLHGVIATAFLSSLSLLLWE